MRDYVGVLTNNELAVRLQRDPKTAREHVNALNKCTKLSKAFRVIKCWGSEADASALVLVMLQG